MVRAALCVFIFGFCCRWEMVGAAEWGYGMVCARLCDGYVMG